jgi:hypothetical protein
MTAPQAAVQVLLAVAEAIRGGGRDPIGVALRDSQIRETGKLLMPMVKLFFLAPPEE